MQFNGGSTMARYFRSILIFSLFCGVPFLSGCPAEPGDNTDDTNDTDNTNDEDYVGGISVSYNPLENTPYAPELVGVTSVAGFGRTEVGDNDFAPLPLDTCQLASREVPPVPIITVHPMDAGSPGKVEVDGNLAYLEGEYNGGVQNPIYIPASQGGIVTVSFPGGVDIGAFSQDIKLPIPVFFSQPTVTYTQTGPTTSFPLDRDLVLKWNAGNPGDDVYIYVDTSGPNGATDACQCRVTDDGEFVIPASYLLSIAFNGNLRRYTLSAERERYKEFAVTLKTGGVATMSIDATANMNITGK
jgi:hypothetical protein